MSSSTHLPGPVLAADLFEAIGRKAWAEVESLTSADVAVEVHAGPGVRTKRNEHLWRSVSLRGHQALRDYLLQLHQAMPALTLQARASARPGPADPEVVRADCAGVDNAGSPFDAETDFAIWSEDGVLLRVEAQVNEVAVGADVIRGSEGDPRKFFEGFLSRSIVES